ncbi:MAG: three-Cys-motif partner protein TcmP [Gemmatimonadota bacterium]|nr:three-Cys-motif partner protein TcmP [Gemmatimonadota bacterium]
MADEPLIVAEDGLHTPPIGEHSLKKIRVHNRYARIFTTAMRDKWEMAYVGLYSGAGRAKVKSTGQIVETSALGALRQPHPFSKYIFVDKKAECTGALARRWPLVNPIANVEIIQRDVNASVGLLRERLPLTKRLLTFCFVDPFDIKLHFETIRKLSDLRIDFLILLMLGNDVRRNFEPYYRPSSTTIADFIGCPDWRREYRENGDPLRFVWTKFDSAMQGLGYPSTLNTTYQVNVTGMGVLLYLLAFYSKDDAGLKLWERTRSSVDKYNSQTSLPFPSEF